MNDTIAKEVHGGLFGLVPEDCDPNFFEVTVAEVQNRAELESESNAQTILKNFHPLQS